MIRSDRIVVANAGNFYSPIKHIAGTRCSTNISWFFGSNFILLLDIIITEVP